MDNKTPLIGVTFAKVFKIIRKLGSGAFGEIYLCMNKQTLEEFAIKLEKADCPHPQVFFEAKLYQYLQQDQQSDKGIPRLHFCGTENNYNLIIMDLLGLSLEDLFQKQKRRFSLKTVLQLGDQMLSRIEFLHTKSFIHRDIKPDNFIMGHGKRQHKVYVIDFGLSKRYISKDQKHIPYKDGKSLTGTARYASINTHLGVEQSRRDDLESIGYVLIYFLRGSLPWQNMKATNKKDKYRQIMEKKMQTPTELLVKGFPKQFASYLNYCKNLRFEDKPDYVYLHSLFREMMQQNAYEMDYIYDWTKVPDQGKRSREHLPHETSQYQNQHPNQQSPQQQQQQQQLGGGHQLTHQQIGVLDESKGEEANTKQYTQEQLIKIRNASMNNINLRTTMHSSNRFSSNRKSIEQQQQQQLQTPGTNLNNDLPSGIDEDTIIKNNLKTQALLLNGPGGPLTNFITNNRILNSDQSTNLYQLPSAGNNKPGTGLYSQNNSIMNTNASRNPALSRLQKQNQKLSELLKLQQQQQLGQKVNVGVPLPKIINHRTYNPYRQ